MNETKYPPPLILIVVGVGYIDPHANKILNKRGFETVVYDNLNRITKPFPHSILPGELTIVIQPFIND